MARKIYFTNHIISLEFQDEFYGIDQLGGNNDTENLFISHNPRLLAAFGNRKNAENVDGIDLNLF